MPNDNNQIENLIKLVVCWVTALQQAGGGAHATDPVGAHQWA
jgi:hypothetical protein